MSVFTAVLDVWMNRNNDEILCNVLLTVFYCYKIQSVLDALKRSTLLDLIIRVVVANLSKVLAKAYAMLMCRLAEDASLRQVLLKKHAMEPLLDCVRKFPKGKTVNSDGFRAMELMSSETGEFAGQQRAVRVYGGHQEPSVHGEST